MTLDKLYSIMKKAGYPIRNRDELERVIGGEKIKFDGHEMDAEEIAVHISKYPIKSISDFFKDFFEEEVESYNLEEAEALGKFETKFEQ